MATHNRFSPPQDTQQEGRPSMEVSSRRRRLRVVWNDDPHSELSQHTPCYKCGPDEWELCQSVHQCQLLFASINGLHCLCLLLRGAVGVDATTPVLETLVSTVSSVSEPVPCS